MLSTPTETTSPRSADAADAAYVGDWTPMGRTIVIEEGDRRRALPMAESAQIGGYAWGRAGAVPREVARAILLDATGNPMLAERLCRPLTWEVVATLPAGGFRLDRAEVLAWVGEQG